MEAGRRLVSKKKYQKLIYLIIRKESSGCWSCVKCEEWFGGGNCL